MYICQGGSCRCLYHAVDSSDTPAPDELNLTRSPEIIAVRYTCASGRSSTPAVGSSCARPHEEDQETRCSTPGLNGECLPA